MKAQEERAYRKVEKHSVNLSIAFRNQRFQSYIYQYVFMQNDVLDLPKMFLILPIKKIRLPRCYNYNFEKSLLRHNYNLTI